MVHRAVGIAQFMLSQRVTGGRVCESGADTDPLALIDFFVDKEGL